MSVPGNRAVTTATAATIAAAVLALTACGSATAATSAPRSAIGPRSATAPPSATVGAAHETRQAVPIPGCRTGVWAENYTDAGALAWRVSLPVPKPYNDGQPLSPVVVGGIAVFADGNALYARRVTDGHGMWHRAFPNESNTLSAGITGTIDGLWAWKGSVIAALGLGSAAPSLVSLNESGAVRYRVKLDNEKVPTGYPAVIRDPVVTADGVMAYVTHGDSLKTIDLSAGKPLWSRTYRKDEGMIAEGGLLIVDNKTSDESPTTLHGVVARTGHTRWTRSGLPNSFQEQPGPDGIFTGYGLRLPPPPPAKQKIYPVLAIAAATGKTLWTLHTASEVTAVWPTRAGVAIATGYPGRVYVADPAARLYLAGLTTGKVRWSVPGTHSDPYTTPVVTGSDVIAVATTPSTGTVIDRNAATGAVRWKAVITPSYGRYLTQPSGQNVLAIFPGATATKPSRLLAVNRATGKTAATVLLPGMATVGAAPAVAGRHALFEPQTLSCEQPAVPGPSQHAAVPAAGHA
jgi:PQQ-like domain